MSDDATRPTEATRPLSPNQRAWRRFYRNKPAVFSAWFLLALVGVILVIGTLQWSLNEQKGDGPLKKTVRDWTRHLPTPLKTHPDAIGAKQFGEPDKQHWFGTDIHGRDLFARVFAGARISLLVGFVGTAVAFVIGVLWGAVSGYAGGRLDSVMMRFVDIMYSLPSIIFVIVLITSLGGVMQDILNPRIRLNDFKQPAVFFSMLSRTNTPVLQEINTRFTQEMRDQLSGYRGDQPPSDDLQKAVTAELNKQIEGPLIFSAGIQAPLNLRSKTRSLAMQKPEGSDLMRLNRLLLEDAFPEYLKHRETWFSLGVAVVFPPESASVMQIMFLFIGLGAVSWLTMARIVRGQVLSLRHRNFVDASRSLGASHRRILFQHILPNVYGVIIVYLTLTLPAIILYESFLSYLGLGIQPPMASWGSLIAEGAQQLNPIRVYWWLIVFPSGALISTLLALNFLGDGLRDAFDPRSEK